MPGPGLNFVGAEELAEVTEVLLSRQLSRYRFNDLEGRISPSKVYQFERVAEKCFGAKHSLALNSCTSALLAGISAMNIGPGDEVIVPGYTFIASIAAIVYARAVPILAEIDESLTLDPEDVERKITPRTKAILAVHMLGGPCNMDKLNEIAERHSICLIEDVAQACGGSYKGRSLGSIGAFGAFSLNVFKTITAGDGGILVTNNTKLYERAFAFHDHGSKPMRFGLADDDSLLGLNLRMNELVGAVALAQIRKLDLIIETLRTKKQLFKSLLKETPGLEFRILNDEEGDCSTALVLFFKDLQQAETIAAALSSRTLLQTGKHFYGNMIQLLNKSLPTAQGCPFTCEQFPTTVEYYNGMLPRTDDILGRAVCLSVGVSDSYLGSDFGIEVTTANQQIVEKVAEFQKLTEGLR